MEFPTPFFAPQPHAVNKIAYISVPKNKTCSGLETQRKWLLLATTIIMPLERLDNLLNEKKNT